LKVLTLTAVLRRHIIVLRMPNSVRSNVAYLRTAEVADILGVTKRTLKNWLSREVIPEPERNPSNRYRRWTLEDVETVRRFLKEREGEK
jgi:predicted DNA-binding transcriptional regulator AlpA